MKIVVVSYSELNDRKEVQEVEEDILSYYFSKNQFLAHEWGSVLRKQFEELSKTRNATIVFEETEIKKKREEMIDSLRAKEIDLLVSYNLAGFEQSTLTDGLAYNLVDCRQLHILEKKNLPNSKLLEKEKSINMFFFEKYDV